MDSLPVPPVIRGDIPGRIINIGMFRTTQVRASAGTTPMHNSASSLVALVHSTAFTSISSAVGTEVAGKLNGKVQGRYYEHLNQLVQ